MGALEKVRGLVARCASGAPRTAPTMALGAIMGLEPIHIAIIGSAMLARSRLSHAGIWKSGGTHTRLPHVPRIEQAIDLPTDRAGIRFCFRKEYQVVIPERCEGSLPALPPGGDVWYTDAAKCNTGVGIGVYHRRNGKGFYRSIGRHPSVFLGEVMAVLVCAYTALEQDPSGEIFICSDSQAALGALNGFYTYSLLVWECMSALNNLAGACRRLTIWWVPAHSGVKGNEIADNLAKMGSRTAFIGPEPVLGAEAGETLAAISDWRSNGCLLFWRNARGGRMAKCLIGPCPPRAWPSEFRRLDRASASRVAQLLTGHSRESRHYLSRIGVCESALCRGCNKEPESMVHILCHCAALAAVRSGLSGSTIIEPEVFSSWSLKRILALGAALLSQLGQP